MAANCSRGLRNTYMVLIVVASVILGCDQHAGTEGNHEGSVSSPLDSKYAAPLLGRSDGFVSINLDGHLIQVHYLRTEPSNTSQPYATVLFFHGLPTGNAIWAPVMKELATLANVDAYAVSFPGFGRSDAPSPAAFDYSESTINQVPFKVADALGINRFTAVAHDIGGPWFLCPATERTNLRRLDGLILLNTATSTRRQPLVPAPAMQRFGELLGNLAVPQPSIQASLRSILQEATFSDVLTNFPEIVDEIAVTNSGESHRLAISAIIEKATSNPSGVGGGCTTSIRLLDRLSPFLIWAPKDPLLGQADELFLRVWPSAAAIQFPNALHFLMFDEVQGIAGGIAEHLDPG